MIAPFSRKCLGVLVALATCAVPLPAAVQTRFYFGLCDASAVETLPANFFAVADDEDNVIRVYAREGDGFPAHSLELSRFLGVDPKKPEADLEAAARIGDRIYWITSHGRNTTGKERISRHRFLATTGTLTDGLIDLSPVGRPYPDLVEDLLREPRLQRFDLAGAAQRPPKSFGALNIEGLAATPQGHLLIGFRNPLPRQLALIVPLLNPADLIAGRPARFGDPLLLDLDGLGIRSLGFWQDQYLVVAGSHDGTGTSRLYLWSGGPERPVRLPAPGLAGFNPEAVAFFQDDGVEQVLLLSDDGTALVGGKPCKKLKTPALKRFRAAIFPTAWLLSPPTEELKR